ncbi:MAG: hypothetical protein AAF204_00315 [Pseudomonadota bacterium]
MSEDPPYPTETQTPDDLTSGPVAGPKVYHSEIDPELKTIAIKKMVEAVKGNGLKPDDVDITKFEGETLEFLAITELVLDTKLSIKHQAGKVTGPMLLPNTNAFQETIDKEAHKIAHSPDVVERIRDAVLDRKDKGLCLKNIKIKLPFLHKDMVVHEACKPCNAKGKVKCTRCHGKQEEPCPRCQAQGAEICPTCGGRQFISGPNGQNQNCQRCNGQGRVNCTQCHGKREVPCTLCKAVGTMQCKQCNGHAWNSVIGMAEIDPIAHYDFDRNGIPSQALEKIDKLGADIQHHANINIIHRHAELEKDRDDISIPYHIKAPLARVTFRLKDRLDVPAFLFGIQGALHDMPPFLEKIMSPGIKSLKAAAMGQGDSAQHLQKAGRYRTLKNLILATSKYSPKKALRITMEQNPLGLSEDNAKKMILMTKQALSLIGKKPAQIGLSIGALVAAFIGAGYVLAARTSLIVLLPQTNLAIALDGLCALLCAGVGYIITKAYAKHAVQKSLTKLFS